MLASISLQLTSHLSHDGETASRGDSGAVVTIVKAEGRCLKRALIPRYQSRQNRLHHIVQYQAAAINARINTGSDLLAKRKSSSEQLGTPNPLLLAVQTMLEEL